MPARFVLSFRLLPAWFGARILEAPPEQEL
jgi:hypothetical protein